MFNLNIIRKDSLTKYIYNSCYNLPIINELNIFLNIKNISKLNKNVILKCIGLIDILNIQKPIIKLLKNKEKNKNKQKNYSIICKITLHRKKKCLYF